MKEWLNDWELHLPLPGNKESTGLHGSDRQIKSSPFNRWWCGGQGADLERSQVSAELGFRAQIFLKEAEERDHIYDLVISLYFFWMPMKNKSHRNTIPEGQSETRAERWWEWQIKGDHTESKDVHGGHSTRSVNIREWAQHGPGGPGCLCLCKGSGGAKTLSPMNRKIVQSNVQQKGREREIEMGKEIQKDLS